MRWVALSTVISTRAGAAIAGLVTSPTSGVPGGGSETIRGALTGSGARFAGSGTSGAPDVFGGAVVELATGAAWVVPSDGSGDGTATATVPGAAAVLVSLAPKVPPAASRDTASWFRSSGLAAGVWEAEARSADATGGEALTAAALC